MSIPLAPSLIKLGSQPCWVTCLLVCVSGDDDDAPTTNIFLIMEGHDLYCDGVAPKGLLYVQ
jgi:hypothetical protein